jgi:hypothetical protein
MIARLLLVSLLPACAVTTPAELGWRMDMPNFRVQKIEWNHVDGRRNLDALCGLGPLWRGNACAVRIIEGGQCIVFSTLREDEAKRVRVWADGWSLWDHELAHCGVVNGKNIGGGWTHIPEIPR